MYAVGLLYNCYSNNGYKLIQEMHRADQLLRSISKTDQDQLVFFSFDQPAVDENDDVRSVSKSIKYTSTKPKENKKLNREAEREKDEEENQRSE